MVVVGNPFSPTPNTTQPKPPTPKINCTPKKFTEHDGAEILIFVAVSTSNFGKVTDHKSWDSYFSQTKREKQQATNTQKRGIAMATVVGAAISK